MARSLHVLLVEDAEDDALLLLRALEKGGYQPAHRRVMNANGLWSALNEEAWDAVLVDYFIPGFGGIQALEIIRESGQDIPVILVSGKIGEDALVEAMKAGAHDCVPKDSLSRLVPAVKREIQEAKVRQDKQQAIKRIQHLNSVLRAIRDVNQLIVTEKNRPRLLQGICNCLISTRGYLNAWIALLDAEGRPQHWYSAGGARAEQKLASAGQQEVPCIPQALAAPGVLQIEDVRSFCTGCPLNLSFETNCAVSVRLEHAGQVFGVLTAATQGDCVHDEEELGLFKEVALDIGLALHAGEMEEGRHRFENELRESEQRYKQVFEQNPIGIYRTTPGGKVLLANPALISMLGYPSFDELAKSDLDDPELFSEYPRAQFKILIERDGQVEGLEGVWRRADGTRLHIRENARAIRGEDGQVLYYEGTAEDITENKRAEEELKHSEERFRTVVEASADALVAIGRNGLIHLFNLAAEHMFGFTRAEVLGQPPAILMPGQFHGQHSKYVSGYFEHGKPASIIGQTVELEAQRKDGAGFPIELSLSKGAQGREDMVLAVIRDITKRKKNEQLIRESHQFLQQVINSVPLRIFWKGLNLHYLGCNEMFASDAGLDSPAQIVGKSDYDMVWRGFADAYRSDDQQVIQSDTAKMGIIERLLLQDGKTIWLSTSKVPLRGLNGSIIGVLGCYADITTLHDTKEQLQQALAELQESHEQLQLHQRQLVQTEKLASLGQLAAGVAHEINNPIAYIKSNLGTLRDYVKTLLELLRVNTGLAASAEAGDEAGVASARTRLIELEEQQSTEFLLNDLNDLITESLRGTDRVRNIVQDLRSFAYAGQEQAKIADLNEVVESSLRLAWNELKYKCEVIKQLNPLPPLRCYPERLCQVFVNILVNAAQAIREHGAVTITTLALADAIEVRIADTGCGIAPSDIPRLFDPFFTTKDIGEGTGLGLAISYTMIQNHGGVIEVDSTAGQGSAFTVRLPLAGIPDEPADAAAHA
jgi:PAS domain S-box-containing protein